MTQSRTDHSSLGALLMSFAAFLWVLHDAISKWLMQDYSIYQVLLLRTVFSLLPILIVVRREGGSRRLRGARVWVCLGRGCLAVACFGFFLAALPLMPLTDVFAIVMSAPLLISALVLVSAAVVIASGIDLLHDERATQTRKHEETQPVILPPGS